MNVRLLYEELGRAIAARRNQIDLTQADVAKAAGISRASLANIEVGRQKVVIDQLYRIATALKLDSASQLLPTLADTAPTERVQVRISADLNARQRAQIERVYKLAPSLKKKDETE